MSLCRALCALCVFLAGAALAQGQSVTLPTEIRTPVGRLATVVVIFDGDDFRYAAPEALDCFREYDPDVKKVRLRLIGYTPGRYQLFAVACKGGKLSEFATCTIIVGDAPPPGPTPPGPGPNPPPDPPSPAPIPADGLRVLMVYESADLPKLPPAQQLVLYAQSVRQYLDSKCVKGADGKTAEWRIWDQNVNPAGEAKLWQDAYARPRKQVPWVIISNGKAGYEGPLPANVDEMLALLKKFGG